MGSHFLVMSFFSVVVGIFFAGLTRDSLREGARAAAFLTVTMIGLSLVVAWLMYLLPLGR